VKEGEVKEGEVKEEEVQEGKSEGGEIDGVQVNNGTQNPRLVDVFAEREAWERDLKRKGTLQLLALPTLGVGLPGLEDWLKCEVRYKKVDSELLRLSRLGGRRMGRREARARAKWLDRWARPRRRSDRASWIRRGWKA